MINCNIDEIASYSFRIKNAEGIIFVRESGAMFGKQFSVLPDFKIA